MHLLFSNYGLGLRSSQPRFEKHDQASRTFFSVAHVIVQLGTGADSSQNACKEAVIQGFPLYLGHWSNYSVNRALIQLVPLKGICINALLMR